jgi:LCP family protein required for cell wall assembly
MNDKPKKKKKVKRHLNPIIYKIIAFLLIVLTVFTFGYTIIKEIFTLYQLIPFMIVAIVFIIIILLVVNSKLRQWVKNIFMLLTILVMIIESLFCIYGTKAFDLLNKITDTGIRVETYGIYVNVDSNYNDIKDLTNKTITYLHMDGTSDIQTALDKFDKDTNLEYTLDSKDNLEDLVNYLVSNKTDAIFMSKSYEDIVKEEYEENYSKLKLIYSFDIINYVKAETSNKDVTKDTFTIYISGIDTSGKVGTKARTDVNILLTINPKTHQVLMINTPRDYYVPLKTSGKSDKLTHSGIYGLEESIGTLENLYDVDIDYYVRINFTSFMKVINALGGIEVDVQKSFCEQDSERNFENQICLKKGVQKLNGEQALAYARHRKTLPKGDMSRGENQMDILEAIMKKAMSPAILKGYDNIIKALMGNVITNMTSDTMITFAKKQLSKNTEWNFTSISADGVAQTKPCYSLGNAKASVVVPNEDSVTVIKKAIENIYNDKSDLIEEIETTTTSSTTKK